MNSNRPAETFTEKLNRKFSSEPLVPIGCLVTLTCLGAGLRAFNQGQAGRSQMLMRGRVLAQGFTVRPTTALTEMHSPPRNLTMLLGGRDDGRRRAAGLEEAARQARHL